MYDQMQSELYRAWDSVQLSTIMYESDDPYSDPRIEQSYGN